MESLERQIKQKDANLRFGEFMEWLVAKHFQKKGWSVESAYLKSNTHSISTGVDELFTKLLKFRRGWILKQQKLSYHADYFLSYLKNKKNFKIKIAADSRLSFDSDPSHSFYLANSLHLDLLRFKGKKAILTEIKATRSSHLNFFFTTPWQTRILRELSRIGIKTTFIFVTALPTPKFSEVEFKILKTFLESRSKLPTNYEKFEENDECLPSYVCFKVPMYNTNRFRYIQLDNEEFPYKDMASLSKAYQNFSETYGLDKKNSIFKAKRAQMLRDRVGHD